MILGKRRNVQLNKGKNHPKRLNSVRNYFMIIIICFPLFLYSQKIDDNKLVNRTNFKQWPRQAQTEPWENIKSYPKIIQTYDSLRVIYKRWTESTLDPLPKYERINFNIPDEIFLPLATAYVSSKLYHTRLNGKGSYNLYWNGYGGSGFLKKQIKKRLPEPWGLLTDITGIVLVEAIKDTILGSESETPFYGYPKDLVLFGRVIDDVLGTIEEDTVLIRHTNPWLENFDLIENTKLLLLLKRGAPAFYKGKKIKIYYCEMFFQEFPQYMLVKNNLIYDEYNVLNINGMKYNNFRNYYISFLEVNGIHK